MLSVCQCGALGLLLPHLALCFPYCMHSRCEAAASLSPRLCPLCFWVGRWQAALWDVLSLPVSHFQPCSHPTPVPFPPSVDQSMFENASASTAPTPRPQHIPTSAGAPPHPPRPAGSQHLRNLGKAMGAKVNDLLRRKEPAGLPSVGVMEVNASAGAMLGTGQPAGEDG